MTACQRPTAPLATGRAIEVAARQSSAGIGTMPLNVVISPDGRFAITASAGFLQQVSCMRISDGQVRSKLDFPRSTANPTNGLYYGLAFGPDGRLYAAQGAAGKIAVLNLSADGKLALDHQISTGAGSFPAGIAVDANNRLYVTHNDPTNRSAPFNAPAWVSVHNGPTGEELGRFVFDKERGLSNFPLAIAVNRDGSCVFVASERDDAVYVLDSSDPAHIALRTTLSTGAQPIALRLSRDQSRLFVANAHSDTVSIVDTATERAVGTVLLRPQIAKDLAGATPTGLALSSDEKSLFVSLGDMNAVAQIDLAEAGGPKLEGYIPAGWYPMAVTVAGGQLLVLNAKGDATRVPHDFSRGTSVTSPLYLFAGTLWRMPIPAAADLPRLTTQCLDDARLTPRYLSGENPLLHLSLQSGKIQHVIFVIKENRSYDQVLGDLPQGNGDPHRCLFPRAITPNQHALAERFILLDNFYDSGEVSGDGWTWTTQAQANEYTTRNVPYHYTDRGRSYDFEGTNNGYPTGGFPALGPDGKPLSAATQFAQGAPAVPDVAASPGGHLWDMARKHGLTFRNYGCFVTDGVRRNNVTIIPDNYPASAGLQPGGRDLAGVTDIDFRRFDLNFPDSEAPSHFAAQFNDNSYLWATHSYGQAKTVSRFSEWNHEFDLMLAKDPTGGAVPQLMMVRFCTDHTLGASAGRPTPRCMVADNDYAVGQLVQTVSRSPIWKSCAILILEDDAQNGPDHVDAHRSPCYLVSPWIKRGTIDHSFQNTVTALRTIESLLNLPPMCQYDAAAGVLGGWDDAPRNDQPYTALLPPAEVMRERTPRPATAPATTRSSTTMALRTPNDLAAASAAMDFSHADQAPADLLNQIIWKSVRGPDSPLPPTPHTLGPAPTRDDDD